MRKERGNGAPWLAASNSRGRRERGGMHVHHQESDWLFYVPNEDEEDCGCFILAKAWLLINTKRTHTQSKNVFYLRWIVGNVGFLGDKRGSMRKDDAVWIRAERQAVWSHVTCGHVFWHCLFLPIMVFITFMAMTRCVVLLQDQRKHRCGDSSRRLP